MTTPNIYAFWEYDVFPRALGGEGEMLENGDIRVPSYQARFKREDIIAVYPLKLGKEKRGQLDALREQHRKAIEQVNKEFAAKAIAILPELKTRFTK